MPQVKTDSYGTTRHYDDEGQLHLSGGPAVIWPDGGQEYYQNGQRHRTEGPAVMRANGYREYWQHGELHRTDGPAVICADGSHEYCRNGRWVDGYHPDLGCAREHITSREEALQRLNSKPRPCTYDLYLADIDRLFPEKKD